MARELSDDKTRNKIMVSSGGFCYSDVSSNNPTIQTHLVNQIQPFESNPHEIFNLTTSIDLIRFPKNLQQPPNDQTSSPMWKGFFTKPIGNPNNPTGGPSSSKPINESTTDHFYQDQFNKPDFTSGISETSGENLLVGGHESSAASWQENRLIVDDSTLRCVFPCEGNEKPSQGLSLSLCSTNPSTIGLQSFELRHTNNNHHNHLEEMRFLDSSSREGYFGKSPENIPQHQQVLQGQFQLRNSKYLGPTQELLNEFCSLGTKQTDVPKQKSKNLKQWEDESGSSSSSSRKQSLCSMELMELQKRKRKLLSMLEEVERRYRHYCDQMKAVVSSFEAVAGTGAATVYSALASKAMSRHFRCLKDGIVAQIHATKKAMGEKDPIAPGTTRGETPRLKVIDQALRQQRAFQQMNMMETHPWRPQRGLPERSVSILRAWLFEHFLHPYPSDVDKHILARQTGLSRSQVSNWFINARVRLWKPMVEEMYLEETKDLENVNNGVSSDGFTDFEESNIDRNSNLNPSLADQKPTPDQLVRIDSECLSSIISNPDKSDNKGSNKAFQSHHLHQEHHGFGNFGTVELDFSSYNHHAPGRVSYANHESDASNHNFNSGGGGGGGVSLTLGLQQHGGNGGVSLAFSSASQNSLFYARDQIEDCQPVQYSLLDGEGQNLPYRNLMGAQLLHDLAG